MPLQNFEPSYSGVNREGRNWLSRLAFSLLGCIAVATFLFPPINYPGTAANLPTIYSDSTRTTMVTLHIALQDGFRDDVITIRVNGEKVFEKSGVTTKLQISYADSFELEIQGGAVTIGIDLPRRNISRSTNLQINSPSYLAINLQSDNKIDFKVSQEPFRYL